MNPAQKPMQKTLDQIDEVALNFTTKNVSISGTSRIGTLKASRSELERQFGSPDTGYPKSTYHWQVKFPDGSVITIYDYHSRNKFAAADEERKWSIGGRDASNIDLLTYLGFEVESWSDTYR